MIRISTRIWQIIDVVPDNLDWDFNESMWFETFIYENNNTHQRVYQTTFLEVCFDLTELYHFNVKHWAGILAIETHHAKTLIFHLLVQNIFCGLLFLKREIYDCLRMHNLLREVNRLVLTFTDHLFRSSLFFFRNLKSFGKYQFWVYEVGSLSSKETICGTVDDI